MPTQIQTFWARLGLNAVSHIRHPAGYVGTWDQVETRNAGTFAKYLGPDIGAAQMASVPTFAGIPDVTTQWLAGGQFLSDPLLRQRVAAGTWTVGFAARLANASASVAWTGVASLAIIDGLTGEKRGTIFDGALIGSTLTATTERTLIEVAVSGSAAEIFGGDYLCLELGISVGNLSGAPVVPQMSLFADGTTLINASGAAISSAASYLVAPQAFGLSLPLPGEQPDASVTIEDALQLVKDGFPPDSPHDWDDTSSPDYELILWIAEVYKRYGYDLNDIFSRELDPQTAVLKLQDWRALYGIQAGRSREELRAAVLARLREFGGTTLFNTAAAVGVLLGYLDPQSLRIYEISAEQQRTALTYVDDFLGTLTLPSDTGYSDSSNFVRRSPVLLDGALLGEMGAQLTLKFFAATGTTRIHAQLTGPDRRTKRWDPITTHQPLEIIRLYAPEFRGTPAHGSWKLNLWREVGSPANGLLKWELLAPGVPTIGAGKVVTGPTELDRNLSVMKGGLGRWKNSWWGVYADPAKLSATQPADFAAVLAYLRRVEHGYQSASLLRSINPIPHAVTTIPKQFIPKS